MKKISRILTLGVCPAWQNEVYALKGHLHATKPAICATLLRNLLERQPERIKVTLSPRPSRKALKITFTVIPPLLSSSVRNQIIWKAPISWGRDHSIFPAAQAFLEKHCGLKKLGDTVTLWLTIDSL